jgi:hypothetical protein
VLLPAYTGSFDRSNRKCLFLATAREEKIKHDSYTDTDPSIDVTDPLLTVQEFETNPIKPNLKDETPSFHQLYLSMPHANADTVCAPSGKRIQ